jgi:hypothetical protein
MLFSEIITVCSQMHTKHINILCRQNVPRSKLFVSVTKTSQSVLYEGITGVRSGIHMEHINIPYGEERVVFQC